MVRLGIIGLGHWGKNFITSVKKIHEARIVVICAKTKKTLDKYPSTFQKTQDYRNLSKFGLDGIVIATPANTHFTITKFFLSRNIPVLVEKPLTTKLSDAIKLQTLVTKSRGKLMVGHEYLYNNAFNTAYGTLVDFGKIELIYSEAGNYGPFRSDTSVLWDYGPHDISMHMHIVGDLPKTVAAYGTKDVIQGRMEFDSVVSYLFLNRLRQTKRRFLMVASKKMSIEYDELLRKKLSLYRKDGSVQECVYPMYMETSPLENELRAFVQYVKNEKKPISDIIHAVNVMKILDTMQKSIITGGKSISLK